MNEPTPTNGRTRVTFAEKPSVGRIIYAIIGKLSQPKLRNPLLFRGIR